MKRLLLAFLLSSTCYLAQAASGCDWWVKANGVWGTSHTSKNTACADMIFIYMDGTPVPKENIQCCDWNGSIYTGSGINCIKLSANPNGEESTPIPTGPPLTDGTTMQSNDRTHGNWVVDAKMRIAMDEAANVSIYYTGLNKHPVLFNLDHKYGNKPVDVTAERIGDEIKVIVNPLEGKTNMLDTKGAEIIIYKVSDLKQKVYQANIGDLVTIFPNPVKEGEPVQLSSGFTDEKVVVSIYNTNACVFSALLTKAPLNVDPAKLGKGIYFYNFIVDGIEVKGGSLVIE